MAHKAPQSTHISGIQAVYQRPIYSLTSRIAKREQHCAIFGFSKLGGCAQWTRIDSGVISTSPRVFPGQKFFHSIRGSHHKPHGLLWASETIVAHVCTTDFPIMENLFLDHLDHDDVSNTTVALCNHYGCKLKNFTSQKY
jgi:hypothetical protein